MTKDQFKALINYVVRAYNADHDIEVAIVAVNTVKNEAIVWSALCPAHGATALAGLAEVHAQGVARMLDKLADLAEEDIAEEILRNCPFNPNEKGA